ncbi:4Fe-4S ferredoxin [Acidobacteria bacterium AB60]|nr:4Fe-4S ferredoxin [Acidobacteria bacterium AB60]
MLHPRPRQGGAEEEPHLELPLLIRAREGADAFPVIASADADGASASPLCGLATKHGVPPLPGPGEQYRFHFDMAKCIGCKCCVVACNEQNGNPADILWRRVGEIEGGTYPHTHRHYLSMGCNHCLEPTCMTGCPVNAYSKDDVTGIVRHSADACIGCQYCTWNCSYGVPQYNAERGVVGKCDMCYGRLALGQEPACAAACPEEAIRIETVNVAEWRSHYGSAANSPGMPSADDSISTTRITLPQRLPGSVRKVDLTHLRPEQPHWPLIVMTVLTQLSVGAFSAIWMLQAFGGQSHRAAALVALLIAGVALTASTLHLGRPIYAVRALKMWRRSWLSREVLLFTMFALAAAGYSAALWMAWRAAGILGGLTALLGICGVTASAKLYLAPGRPAWNSWFTLAAFGNTAALLGACAGNILTHGADEARVAVLIAAGLMAATELSRIAWLVRSPVHELHGAGQLINTVFSHHVMMRFVLPCAGMVLLAFCGQVWVRLALMVVVLAGEFVGRYLFFVSVVPTNMAREYLAQEAA